MKTKHTAASTDKLTLAVKTRDVFGKKLRKLRIDGSIPANIFGPDFKSHAVTVNFKEFIPAYKVAKETGIVYLKYDSQEVPVMIKHLQKHPVSDAILHIDFRKIDLTKKIQTNVPVRVVGISEAVSQKGGVLLTQAENLLVEALPADIPQAIEIDISTVKELGQEIKVADLAKSAKYEIKTPAEHVIVSVVAHKEESTTAETAAVATEVIGEEKAVEGEAPAEDAAPAGKPAETGKKPEAATTPKAEEKKK